MRKFLFLPALAIFCGQAAADTEVVGVRNLAPLFTATYDATASLPMPDRVAAMKKALQGAYPEFYGRGTPERQDKAIEEAIERFPRLRAAYVDKAEKFGGALQQHMATFNRTFPDFRLTVPTAVVHSLYEMDGGTREFGGKQHLIFGADMMAYVNPNGDPAPLFHHELFHVLHRQHFDCADGAVWSQLWVEGLATYVSKALNPSATETDLLLDFPKGMAEQTRAHLPAAWRNLRAALDSTYSTGSKAYGELFMMNSGTQPVLPRRHGYYLGYLVAQDAAKTRSLTELAVLDCKQTRALIESTVEKLSKENQE